MSRNNFVGSMNITCNNKAQPIVNNQANNDDDQEYAENRIILSDCAGEVDCDFVCCSDCFDRNGASTTNFCEQSSSENTVSVHSALCLSRGMLNLQVKYDASIEANNKAGQTFGTIQ